MSAVIEGTVYFASTEAIRTRHYREGQPIKTDAYVSVRYLSPTFAQVEFDTTGRNYAHVTIARPTGDPA